MSRRVTFTQSDLTRVLKAAKAANIPVGRIEIEPNGKIVMVPDKGPGEPSQDDANEWDKALTNEDAVK